MISTQNKQTRYRVRYGREIKMRLFYILLSSFFSFVTSLQFSEQFTFFLTLPLKQAYEWSSSGSSSYQAHFIFTELTEAFFARIQVSAFVTLYCFLFLLLYQL